MNHRHSFLPARSPIPCNPMVYARLAGGGPSRLSSTFQPIRTNTPVFGAARSTSRAEKALSERNCPGPGPGHFFSEVYHVFLQQIVMKSKTRAGRVGEGEIPSSPAVERMARQAACTGKSRGRRPDDRGGASAGRGVSPYHAGNHSAPPSERNCPGPGPLPLDFPASILYTVRKSGRMRHPNTGSGP